MAERVLFALVAAAALAGCSGVDHVQMEGVTGMPDDSQLTLQGGTLREGIATAFKPHVWTRNWHGGTDQHDDGIDVQSSNPDVVRVAHVTSDTRVVVWGVGKGQATISITYNGEVAQNVPVQVLDPMPQ